MTNPTTEQLEKARQASLADFFTQNGFETERIHPGFALYCGCVHD